MNRRANPYSPPPIVPIHRGRPIPEIVALHGSLDRYDQYLQSVMNDLVGPNGIINTGSQGAGTNIASAATISISDFLHNVTGTQTITTINPPSGFSAPAILFSQDGFSLGAGGNIVMPQAAPVQIPAGSYTQLVYHANVGKWKVTGLGGGQPTVVGVRFNPVVLGVAGSPHTMAFGEFLLASAATGTNFTANLPAATGSGLTCMAKKMDATTGSVVLTAPGGTIDDAATKALVNQYYALTVVDYAAGKWAIGAFY